MKIVKQLSILLFATGLSSCVSMKDYETTINGWEKNYNSLYRDYARVMQEKEQLNAKTQRDQELLNEHHIALLEKERQLIEYKSLMDARHNQLSLIRQEVSSCLACFSGNEVRVEEREGMLYVSMSDKLFSMQKKADTAELEKAMADIAEIIKEKNLLVIVVQSVKPAKSSANSKKVKDMLSKKGVSADEMFINKQNKDSFETGIILRMEKAIKNSEAGLSSVDSK